MNKYKPDRLANETLEQYNLRKLAETDRKMADAKIRFGTDAYYKQFLKSSNKDMGYNPYQE